MMEILKEAAMHVGLSLGIISLSMGYVIGLMALGRLFVEVVDFILDWKRK